MKQIIEQLMKQGLSLEQALKQIKKEKAQEDKNLKMYKVMCRYR